jgi:hypothetical protein
MVPTSASRGTLCAIAPKKGERMENNYICGIIEESLIDQSVLNKIKKYLKKTRIEKRKNEKPSEWHVNEYHLPFSVFEKIKIELETNTKKEWYIHAFNLNINKLIVIFKNKSFEISIKKDQTWNEMIEYGKSVGCGPEWTENILLRV